MDVGMCMTLSSAEFSFDSFHIFYFSYKYLSKKLSAHMFALKPVQQKIFYNQIGGF